MGFGLEDIKIVETASAMAGPIAGRLLADWGADVIHIEHPIRGDITRSKTAGGWAIGKIIASEVDYGAQIYHRNKRNMTLDLSKENGLRILYRLLEKADVFLSNFRPRELKNFKLDFEILRQLNPRLIPAHLTGWGREGPDKDKPGYDSISYFAESGISHVLLRPGTEPVQIPIAFGDNVGGLALAYGIMTALYIREKTGIGQEVDASLFHARIFALSFDISGALVTGQDRQPAEREDVASALMTFYQTKDDRWFRLAVHQPDPYWSRFCRVIERADLEHDPRFASFEDQMKNHVALFNILKEVFLTKTLYEWVDRFDNAGIPCGPIKNLPEVITDPQAKEAGIFVSFEHPIYGPMGIVANPIKLSETSAAKIRPAPEFGQHTEEILLEHGYTWQDIEQFKEEGAIA